MKTVLLTGGTGSLGKYLIQDLLKYNELRLILLVRGESDDKAHERIVSTVNVPDNVEIYAADLLSPSLGLSEERYRDLAGRVTDILHSAASTRFNSPLEEARKNNVETTGQMISFAKECKHLARFGYLSTALVAGKQMGVIKEDDFEHDAGFNNTYQQSKHEAEALVRDSGLPTVIFRPPLVYSAEEPERSVSLTSFLTLLVKMVVSGRIPFVPGTKKSSMDIVRASDTSRIVVELFLKDTLSYMVYHITNGATGLTVGDFHAMMEEEKGAPIPIEYLGDADAGMQRVHEKAKAAHLTQIYERAESFLSEPGYPKVFDNSHTLAELGIDRIGDEPKVILREAVHNAIWNSST